MEKATETLVLHQHAFCMSSTLKICQSFLNSTPQAWQATMQNTMPKNAIKTPPQHGVVKFDFKLGA